ncbi:MFS transporter [Metapseudomonas resinovorans]|uniref:MFS transporter n=1 Tax=Metapseudomonas resinovorans TaxID=53412 RepID=UPI0009DB7389|nr:MFS transporter [Pseudomonas resinovorans]
MDNPNHTPLTYSLQKSASVAFLISIVLLSAFPLDVILPSFPSIANSFNVAPENAITTITAFALGFSLSQIFAGPFSDIYGRKIVLIIGLAISSVSSIACTLTEDFHLLLFSRFIQGIGCGSFVLAQAIVQDTFSDSERLKIRTLLVTASGVFISLSPLAGIFIQEHLDWKGSFYIFSWLAILVSACSAFIYMKTVPGKTPCSPLKHFTEAYIKIFSNTKFTSSWLISALAFSCHFSFVALSPIIFNEVLTENPINFGFILLFYGFSYLVAGILATRIFKRSSLEKQITCGITLILLSGITMAISHTVFPALSITLICMITCTIGTTFVRPAAASRAMDIFHDLSGTASAAGSTLMFITAGLISFLVSQTNFDKEFALSTAIILAAIISTLLNIKAKE